MALHESAERVIAYFFEKERDGWPSDRELRATGEWYVAVGELRTYPERLTRHGLAAVQAVNVRVVVDSAAKDQL